jgi:WD40-like Beta Propeller Repeat
MIRKSLMALILFAAGMVATDARQDAKKWDVTDPTGPTTTMAFDTSEGTWMNVDVSPDGTQVVFDLLGDIYVVPIAGSRTPARRLTSGPVFDMQAHFSPDGKRIAIASDRDGLWNIWTIDLDGKDARQITRERRWFVNSPAWSPDGAYIYARRHFVKERSLGAGEIWMYHAAGPGDGLQVTERNGWQKDAGEPDISPDGAALYYSKDVTPGSVVRRPSARSASRATTSSGETQGRCSSRPPVSSRS